VENFNNLRLMRLGDNASDLELSDDSDSSDEESESSEDKDDNALHLAYPSSSATSLPTSTLNIKSQDSVAESEFQNEVVQSLERAFAEGHSIDNAAVELKTLRMASNVPLSRVRAAVVGAIVEQIKIVDGGAVPQRNEIARVVDRWGGLINKIGGVDAVETVTVLQTHCASSPRLPLFGQILAALYQEDIVEEEDIRRWHSLPSSKGSDHPASMTENIMKCWTVGGRMISQFDEQDSEDESENEGEESEEGDESRDESDDDDGSEAHSS